MTEPQITSITIYDADLVQLKSYMGDPDPVVFTDAVLQEIIALTANDNGTANIYRAASEVWSRKAARYAELVAVGEAGSSRDLGALHRQALTMASHYSGLALASGGGAGASSRTRVGRIRRP